MKEIRVGIIGAGAISHRHMKVYNHIPGMKVVAIAEIDEKKLKEWSEQYKVADTYTDFREMLKRDDIASVDVCVHNNLHAPISIAVMKAGKECYCEKPMSASYADSKLMYNCAQKLGRKFAVQISSLFSGQTKIGKQIIDDGMLGKIYHARSCSTNYRRRPVVEFKLASTDFIRKEVAGHGQTIDIGIYTLSQMLFLLGLPELESVYGMSYQALPIPEGTTRGENFGVEDMGVAMAKYKGGLTLEFIEASATNMEDTGKSYITGTKAALQYWAVDQVGGDWSMGQGWTNELPAFMQPQMRFVGEYNGIHVDVDLRTYYNQQLQKGYDTKAMMWYDNQMHWYYYLTGVLNDQTRYNTPLIAMNHSLLVDGLFMSCELGRSVTADEIKGKSKSTAIWKQQTPYGIFDYESTF
jgi:predicted dehydrogenase